MRGILVAGLLALGGCAKDDIHWAASHGRAAQVKELLAKDPSLAKKTGVDAMTPLHLAANAETAQLLLDAGADVNAQAIIGRLPIHTAVSGDVAELLLSKGADANAKDGRYQTPLAFAAKARRLDVIKALLAGGADPDAARWSTGLLQYEIALHLAVDDGDRPMIEALLQKGSIDALDGAGASALFHAVANDDNAMAAFLLEKGANPNLKLPAGTTLGKKILGVTSNEERGVGGLSTLRLAKSDAMRKLLKDKGAAE